MDSETSATQRARLGGGRLAGLEGEQCVVDYGAIILCTAGTATLTIDFKPWRLERDSVIMLFPGEAAMLGGASPDFSVLELRYDKAMLREASLQMEHAVYTLLRKDRCCSGGGVVADIVKGMFGLIGKYTALPSTKCAGQIVLCQLKAFFLGFYEHSLACGQTSAGAWSRRTDELFGMFMETLEAEYMRARDVAYFAARLNITPKYLNNIVRGVTGHTTKAVIDHYVILQLKLRLRDKRRSIKQIAWEFNFSDTSFFSRYFKQHTGMTPHGFRRSQSPPGEWLPTATPAAAARFAVDGLS